jgi:hypothetical protein
VRLFARRLALALVVSLALSACARSWNDDLVDGRLSAATLAKALPLGSDYSRFQAYAKSRSIPSLANSTYGYSEPDRDLDLPFYLDAETLKKIGFVIRLEGHRQYRGDPRHYEHPVIYLCYDAESRLVHCEEWTFP